MTANKLTHKGFTGSYEISFEDECLIGRILFIEDIVTYEGENPAALTASFKAAVDRYLAYCKKTGQAANQPFSGSFNVRVGAELHRKAAEEATACSKSLNEIVIEALEARTDRKFAGQVEHKHHHVITVAQPEFAMQAWATQSTSAIQENIRVSAYH